VTSIAALHVTCQDGDVDGFAFAGDLALDFVGTRRSRRSNPEERILDSASLDAWFSAAGLHPHRQPTAEELSVAVSLREAIYALVIARVQADAFGLAHLALVNYWAAHPPIIRRLTPSGVEVVSTPASAFALVARDAVDVLSSPGLPVKECSREGCTRLFVDRSHGARRTWCGMNECGNRVKAAAYRARRKQIATIR
jgi:predicted RNA-binding Zn ribbon-like protein